MTAGVNSVPRYSRASRYSSTSLQHTWAAGSLFLIAAFMVLAIASVLKVGNAIKRSISANVPNSCKPTAQVCISEVQCNTLHRSSKM